MKTKVLIGLILMVFLVGCAGMDYRHQQNMTSNAGIWGVIGAATGAGLAAATGGNAGKAALIGGIAGAYLGAANTPSAYGPSYGPASMSGPVDVFPPYSLGGAAAYPASNFTGFGGDCSAGPTVFRGKCRDYWYNFGRGRGDCNFAPSGTARVYCERGFNMTVDKDRVRIKNLYHTGW